MPVYSRTSRERLDSCHEDLQRLFYEVIKGFDCKILYGHRTADEQMELFKRGRVLTESGVWVVENPLLVVTNKDGHNKPSKHNFLPSLAVDVVPYYSTPAHIRWKDTNRMYFFAGYVLGIAEQMGIKIRSGADWDRDTEVMDQTFVDLPHFEIAQ